ncbi:MAG: hypothetical protein LBT83_02695 [Tannerella sp.]|nr:hypothetical protein [Tannerella sp.]
MHVAAAKIAVAASAGVLHDCKSPALRATVCCTAVYLRRCGRRCVARLKIVGATGDGVLNGCKLSSLQATACCTAIYLRRCGRRIAASGQTLAVKSA